MLIKKILGSLCVTAMIMSAGTPVYAKKPASTVRRSSSSKSKKKAGRKKVYSISLSIGDTKTVSVKTTKKVKWTVSNKKIAAIDYAYTDENYAQISAKSKGNTKITAKAGKNRWIFNVKVKETLLEKKAKAILKKAGIRNSMPDIQKFARLCRWWSNNVKYDDEENKTINEFDYKNNIWKCDEKYLSRLKKYGTHNLIHNYGAVRITELRKGICGDQANAIAYYCNLMGVKAKLVHGTIHAWNHVYLDDGWYTFDATDIIDISSGEEGSLFGGCITLSDWYKSAYYTIDFKKSDEQDKNYLIKSLENKGASEDEINARIQKYQQRLDEAYSESSVYHLAYDGNSDESYLKADWATKAQVKKYNKELNGKKYVNAILGNYI